MFHRISWDGYFLRLAGLAASRSTCPRLAVGAVLVLENRVLATGYNGSRSGEDHCLDVGCDLLPCQVHGEHCTRAVHAEENIIDQLGWMAGLYKSNFELLPNEELILYLTHEPCSFCRSRLEERFITEYRWSKPYREHYAEGECSLLSPSS